MNVKEYAPPVLPKNAKMTRATKTFTHDTVPKGLLANHSTAANTWGVICIEEGTLTYHVTEPGNEAQLVLDAQTNCVITPAQRHHLEMTGAVKFHIEFYEIVQASLLND